MSGWKAGIHKAIHLRQSTWANILPTRLKKRAVRQWSAVDMTIPFTERAQTPIGAASFFLRREKLVSLLGKRRGADEYI